MTAADDWDRQSQFYFLLSAITAPLCRHFDGSDCEPGVTCYPHSRCAGCP